MKKQKSPAMHLNATLTADAVELKTITDFIIKKFKIEKVICFGSIVNHVENISCFKEMVQEKELKQLNSFYLLIVPDSQELLADIVIQMQLEEDLKGIASVTIIVHRMEEINKALENGSSFFTTIYKKGTMLYDQEIEPFVVPGSGTTINKRILKRENFWHQWYNLSEGFLKGAAFFEQSNHPNLSLYMLHQSLQHCYSGMLRVLTGYRTNTNGLRRLMKLIDNILPASAFSDRKTPEEGRLTTLLLKGLGDARYSEKFEISDQELSQIKSRVQAILDKANNACLMHIEKLKEGKAPYIA